MTEAETSDAVLDAWMTAEMIQEMLQTNADTQRPVLLLKYLVDQLQKLRYSLTGET